MHKISRELSFCYGHRLINYDGKCRNLHGHNGKVIITLSANSLDEQGMVADFSGIKKSVSPWIDAEFDHRMLLYREDPFVPILLSQGDPVKVLDCHPTAENIARLIYEFAKEEGHPVSEVVLWETPSCSASYSERSD